MMYGLEFNRDLNMRLSGSPDDSDTKFETKSHRNRESSRRVQSQKSERDKCYYIFTIDTESPDVIFELHRVYIEVKPSTGFL